MASMIKKQVSRYYESPWAAITSRAEVEAAQGAAPDKVEVGVVSRMLPATSRRE